MEYPAGTFPDDQYTWYNPADLARAWWYEGTTKAQAAFTTGAENIGVMYSGVTKPASDFSQGVKGWILTGLIVVGAGIALRKWSKKK